MRTAELKNIKVVKTVEEKDRWYIYEVKTEKLLAEIYTNKADAISVGAIFGNVVRVED